MDQKKNLLDVAVIGGGAAGLTAALYAARAGERVRVYNGGAGSRIFGAHAVENFPAFHGSGADFIAALEEQARSSGAELAFGEVTAVTPSADGYTVAVGEEAIAARRVILATGALPRPLGVVGERELVGRGVSYCALCDGRFYRDRDVVVVGGGNSAVGEALYLAKLARSVTLVHRRDAFRAEAKTVAELKAHEKITILYNSTVKSVLGDAAVTGVALENAVNGERRTLACDAVFFAVGSVPASQLLDGLARTENGFYRTDERMRCLDRETGAPIRGLYAVGDARVTVMQQLVVACADGAIAAADDGK